MLILYFLWASQLITQIEIFLYNKFKIFLDWVSFPRLIEKLYLKIIKCYLLSNFVFRRFAKNSNSVSNDLTVEILKQPIRS